MLLKKEAIALVELALWKAKLLYMRMRRSAKVTTKVKIDDEAARKEHRFTFGASKVTRMCYLSLHWCSHRSKETFSCIKLKSTDTSGVRVSNATVIYGELILQVDF